MKRIFWKLGLPFVAKAMKGKIGFVLGSFWVRFGFELGLFLVRFGFELGLFLAFDKNVYFAISFCNSSTCNPSSLRFAVINWVCFA